MTTPRPRSSSVARRRQFRGWFGVLLMVVSLFGGYRVATRMSEETSNEQTSEVQEYAHRQAEGHSPRRRMRGDADGRSVVESSPDAATASRPAGPRGGESPSQGHRIANGLRAPLRC